MNKPTEYRTQAIKNVAEAFRCDPYVLGAQMFMDPKDLCKNAEYEVYAVDQREKLLNFEYAWKAAIQERDQARALAEWRPITPDSLPKVGDEAWGSYTAYSGSCRCYLQAITEQHVVTPETMRVSGFTHYRPLNAPAPVAAKEAE